MRDDTEDLAPLNRHHDRLEGLYAVLEHSRSRETIDAMLIACAAIRLVRNPRYQYAIEQVGWIKGPLKFTTQSSGDSLINEGNFSSFSDEY